VTVLIGRSFVTRPRSRRSERVDPAHHLVVDLDRGPSAQLPRQKTWSRVIDPSGVVSPKSIEPVAGMRGEGVPAHGRRASRGRP
jgi:hypothetical protein